MLEKIDGKKESPGITDDSHVTIIEEADEDAHIFVRTNLKNEFHGIPAGKVKIIRIQD